jgi:hypothetical protein
MVVLESVFQLRVSFLFLSRVLVTIWGWMILKKSSERVAPTAGAGVDEKRKISRGPSRGATWLMAKSSPPARLLAALMQDERLLYTVRPPSCSHQAYFFIRADVIFICGHSVVLRSSIQFFPVVIRVSTVFVFFFFFFNVSNLFFQQQVRHSFLFHAPAIINNEIVFDYQHRHHQVQVQIRIIHRPPRQHSIPLSPPPPHNTEIAQTKLMKSYPSFDNGVELRVLTETKAKESGGMCARSSPRKQLI